MHVAAFKGNLDVIKALIPLVDNLIARDQFGRTPLHVAALNPMGNVDVIKLLAPLVDYPNVPDQTGMTPIQLACHHVASFETYKEIKIFLTKSAMTANFSNLQIK